ncbi:hypothetical protein SADUNF_Sadunf17G0052500 [Salix dunnii]|uniref:Uncharacterized protein n=1 Tax=Salix dunnii TaxID=1413687 RepID=A0A835J605_9ROSI|nr:hypothetical protein SADUNF_Sadunf17G0052500 [Salix dunnii]
MKRYRDYSEDDSRVIFSQIAEDAIISEAARDGVVLGWRTDAPQDFQERMKAILGGYDDLIDGYNSLMPSCHQISLDDVEEGNWGG